MNSSLEETNLVSFFHFSESDHYVEVELSSTWPAPLRRSVMNRIVGVASNAEEMVCTLFVSLVSNVLFFLLVLRLSRQLDDLAHLSVLLENDRGRAATAGAGVRGGTGASSATTGADVEPRNVGAEFISWLWPFSSSSTSTSASNGGSNGALGALKHPNALLAPVHVGYLPFTKNFESLLPKQNTTVSEIWLEIGANAFDYLVEEKRMKDAYDLGMGMG